METPVRSSRLVHMLFVSTILLNILMPFLMRLYGAQMYSFYFIVYTWVGLYALFLAVLVRKHRLGDYRLIGNRASLIIAVVLTLLTRFAFLGMSEQISLDALWYLDFGTFMKMGMVPYSGFYFPYPPAFAYVIMAVAFLLPSIDSFRVIMTIADIGVGLVLCKLAQKITGKHWGESTFLIYALLPIAVIESGWSGHFEAIVNLLMLAAIWFMLMKRPLLTGLFVGLAAAMKIYPALFFPVALFYLHGWRERTKLTITTLVAAGVTYVPFLVLDPFSTAGAASAGQDIVGSFWSRLVGILGEGPALPMNIMAIIAACLVVLASIWFAYHRDPDTRSTSFNLAVLLLGIMLVAMGGLAGIYPLTSESILVSWRFPADIGIMRGICTIVVGVAIMYQAARGLKQPTGMSLSTESLVFLGAAIALLLVSMSRTQMFGWYLLWSLPIFLLLKNRRLALTVGLCLLLIYPGYTHDNFASLGFQEQSIWSNDMTNTGNWSINVYRLGIRADPGNISAGVESTESGARFWFDTTKLGDSNSLNGVTLWYTEAAYIEFGPLTEFAARIKSGWDPTFGELAVFRLIFQGILENGTDVWATIASPSTALTNLTWTSCRSNFISHSEAIGGHTFNLTVVITPRVLVRSGYEIGVMYTTYDGPLDTAYLPIVGSVMIFVLASCFLLRRELAELERSELGVTISE